MIQIKYNDTVYDIRNTLDEITVEEFEYISHTLTRVGISTIDLWMDIWESLNVDPILLDNLDLDNFLELVKSFDFVTYDNTIKQTINIDGTDYSCYTDSFRLKIKELSKIELMISNGFYLSRILAYLYKNDNIVQDVKHLNYKIAFFKTQPASLVMPILDNINGILIKKLESINE